MTFSESIDRFFMISKRGSTIPTEIKGGIITFLAMVYILPVNVTILSGAFPEGQAPLAALYASTALAAILSTVLMALYARCPVGMASGMGLNIFVVNTICISMGFTFYQALMAVFISGLLYFVLSLTRFMKSVIDAIPMSIKAAMIAGIGLMIIVVGLFNSGIIVSTGSTPSLGNFGDPKVILALFCITVTLVLFVLKKWYAILLGMAATCVVGCLTGVIDTHFLTIDNIFKVPDLSLVGKFITGFGTIDITYLPSLLVAIMSLTLVLMFDSVGTLMGAGKVSGVTDENGNLENMDKAMRVDAIGSMIGGSAGTSPTMSFVESCTGIESGARTGLMAIVVAMFFLVALFFSAPFGLITSACTSGALVIIGIIMMTSVAQIDWKDNVIGASSILTIIFMGLSGSISEGLGFGVISYCVGMIITKRYKEVSWIMYLLALIFIIYIILMKGIFFKH